MQVSYELFNIRERSIQEYLNTRLRAQTTTDLLNTLLLKTYINKKIQFKNETYEYNIHSKTCIIDSGKLIIYYISYATYSLTWNSVNCGPYPSNSYYVFKVNQVLLYSCYQARPSTVIFDYDI